MDTLIATTTPTAAIVAVARDLAIEFHAGDRNKHDGEVYLLHVSRVAANARAMAIHEGLDPELAEAAAWLHDTPEDTVGSIAKLRQRFYAHHLYATGGYTPDEVELVLETVDLLTKRPGEANEVYYRRMQPHPYANLCKRGDMKDNFRRNHLIEDEATRARMAAKYSLGMDILG